MSGSLLNDKEIDNVADFIYNLHAWVAATDEGKVSVASLTEQYERVLPLLIKAALEPKKVLFSGDLISGDVIAFHEVSGEIERKHQEMQMVESSLGVTMVPSIAIFSETLKEFAPKRGLERRGEVLSKLDWRSVIADESQSIGQIPETILREQHPLYDAFEHAKSLFNLTVLTALIEKQEKHAEILEKTIRPAIHRLAAAVALNETELYGDLPFFKDLMITNGILKEGETPTVKQALNEVREVLIAQKIGNQLRQQIIRKLQTDLTELGANPDGNQPSRGNKRW